MSYRLVFGTGLICLAIGLTARAQQTTVRMQPGRTQSNAQAKAVFVEACGRCHPIERVTATRRTKAQWEETINQMTTSRGAVLTAEQYDTVLKYLVAEYSTTTPAPTATPGTRPAPTRLPAPPPVVPPGQTPGTVPGAAGGAPTTPPRPRGGAGPDDKMYVEPVASARGRTIYAAACIQCHGTQARGTERGTNLLRSLVILHDRYGSELGRFLRKGHPTQSGPSSASYTDAQMTDLSHFIHEKFNDTLRGAPGFTVQNVLNGDKQAGAAYFAGAGGCTQCHSATGDLAGIGKKYEAPALQQRFLFPRPPGRRGGGGGPGKPTTLTVTTPAGEKVTGVLVSLDDFNVAVRDEAGQYRAWKRVHGLTVVKNDPYAGHVELLDKYTDKNIHDVVAYLESLK
jgi:cytochrome c oxidase cbb3-type subunit 3